VAQTRTINRPRPGDELELSVDRLAFGGAGVARLNGYVVFVTGAVPGDRVRARVGRAKRAYAEARVLELLEPSPDRVAPRAEHPGAPWQVLPYARQLEVKQAQVEEALRRLGQLRHFQLEPIIPAAQQWRYRNKLEYSFGADPSGRLICGFHAPGRWDEIVEVRDCLLASEAANAARERVVEWCRAAGLTPYDRRSGRGLLRNLVVREGRATGQIQLRLVVSDPASGLVPESSGLAPDPAPDVPDATPGLVPDPAPDVPDATPVPAAEPAPQLDRDALARAAQPCAGLLLTRVRGVAETTAEGETELLAGEPGLEEELGGLRIRISPEAFFQTNTEMAEVLYRQALALAELTGVERVYDLYCGIGTIALLAAPRAAEVWGLELVEAAIADAIGNARRNEVTNVHFFAGDARLALRELTERAGRPEVIVVDPPRAGLSQKVVRRIIDAAPRRLVYVSCNPTTLAPNAAQLVAAGYELARVRPVDMFPQTPHIECVAEFVKIRA